MASHDCLLCAGDNNEYIATFLDICKANALEGITMEGSKMTVFTVVRSSWHAQKIVNDVCRELNIKKIDIQMKTDKMFREKKLVPTMVFTSDESTVKVTGNKLDYLAGFIMGPVFDGKHIDSDSFEINITAEKTADIIKADLKELATEWGWELSTSI